MNAVETIALIKDLFIIVASGVFILVLLGIGLMALRIYMRVYPPIRRTAQNLEQTSQIVYNVVSQPMNLVSGIMEAASSLAGVVERFRSRERRNEEDEDK
jgi:hypothetical protein